MWSYKIANINMPADWIELFIEYTPPIGNKFTKMYTLQTPMTQEQITNFINEQITKLESLSTNYEYLSNLLGQEVTVGGG